jgi:hypothetical protein
VKAIVPLVIILAVLIWFQTSTSSVPGPQSDLAVKLADQIKSLPTIDDQTCQGSSELVSNAVIIIQDMDGTLGTGFGRIAQFDASNCDVVIQFLPILGSYNTLVRDSRSLDATNSTSVKAFYEDAFLLSSDFVILNDKLVYKVAFRSTGEINDALKLAKLRSVCGDECYRVVLSGIHWTIRVKLDQYICEFEDWAGQSVQLPSRYC